MPSPTPQKPEPEDPKKDSSTFVDLILQNLKKLPSLAEKTEVSRHQLEMLYSVGIELYYSGLFEKAADLFRLLCFYEQANPKHWIALGGAHQHTKDHERALASFAMASLYDPQNPEPKLYAAHSLIDLGDLPRSLECAQAAVQLCKNKPADTLIKSRADALCHALRHHLNAPQ